MKEEIHREDTRNLESFVDRLEKLLSEPTARTHKIGKTKNNIAGNNTNHLPNFSTSNIINSELWKRNNSGS